MLNTQSKICRDCQRDLPFSEYHKNKESKFGLRPDCKNCVKEYRRKYYLKNQEDRKEYSRAYYAENAEAVKSYQRQYNKKNKKEIAKRTKNYREQNREILLKRKREDYRRNRDRYLSLLIAYSKQHPEYNRVTTIRRRGKLKNIKGDLTAPQLLAKCEYHGWRCYLCKTPLDFTTVEFDHLIPLSRGGTNWISNIAPSCKSCNQQKGNKKPKEL